MDRRGFIKALTAGAAVAGLSAQGGPSIAEAPPVQPKMRLRQILIDDSRDMARSLNSSEGEQVLIRYLRKQRGLRQRIEL